MLRLAALLIGYPSIRRQWTVLMLLGFLQIALACQMVISPVSGADRLIILLFSIPLLARAVTAAISLVKTKGRAIRPTDLTFLFLITLLFVGIAGSAVIEGRAFSTLLAAVLLLDGTVRLVLAVASRYPAWHHNVATSTVELVLAVMLALNWPVSEDRATTTTVALLIGMAGWELMRFASLLRTHQHEAALLLMPMFGKRGWYDHAPVLADHTAEPETQVGPMTLYVWMPTFMSGTARSVPVVNRYIMAQDHNGNLSVGHVALELPSGPYISHYRDLEASPLPGRFLAIIGSKPENQYPGLFRPSYEEEQDLWGAAHRRILFYKFSPRRIRAFWTGYRQDSTYNVVNRNCSTLVAAALDASLEGALSSPRPSRPFFRLLATPDFWQAAFIRNRAESTTWTPGLIHDYAEPLARIINRDSNT